MKHDKKDSFSPPAGSLWFVPLGGCGEIGMNFSLYGTDGKWLIVDCGISFPDETMPGIEILTPDPTFIAERKDSIVGMVITHGHEDHLGAISYLWSRLQCPIYASPFNAEMIRGKLDYDKKKKSNARVTEIPLGGKIQLGPFNIDFVPVTHSVPESQMLAIEAAGARILHTGDWKFDPNPVVGAPTDFAALKALGKKGVTALVCDSTNALEEGHSGSEQDVQPALASVFDRCPKRIIVTCFSSNIARLKTICAVARLKGRKVALVGRSIWRNAEIAEACNYFPEFKHVLDEDEAMSVPPEKIVIVCTGCQGENRAVLARVATGTHPHLKPEEGDTVIFSSREIPGNEKAIARVQNGLLEMGLSLITPADAPVHVSGHPKQDELHELYKIIKPKIAMPVHGERRHQSKQARMAKEWGAEEVVIPSDGDIVQLFPGKAKKVGSVPVGRLGLDGAILRSLDGGAVGVRRKVSFAGAVVVTVALNRRGMVVSDPQISLLGVENEAEVEAVRGDLTNAVFDALDRLDGDAIEDDRVVKQAMQKTIRQRLNDAYGKKPVVEANVIRV